MVKNRAGATTLKRAVAFFSQLDKLVDQTAEMDQVFSAYLRGIAHFLKAKRVSLMMLEEKSQQLFIRAAEGLGSEIKANTRIALGKGIAGWVALKGKSVLIQNIARHRQFSKEKKGKGFRSGSFISIPIKVRGKVYGVLNVAEKKDSKPFSGQELESLKFFGIQLAIFLENQKLRKEIQDLASKTVQELAAISHDFRMPLACAQEALRLVEEVEQGNEVSQERKQFLEIAKRNLQRMMNIFDDLIQTVTEEKNGEEKGEEIDLKGLLNELIQEFRVKAARREVTLELRVAAGPLRLVSDAGKIRGVLMNLLDNAIKYTREQTTVTVSARETKDAVRLEVKDCGPGIGTGERNGLFDRAVNIRKCRERGGDREGHGLGLAISKEIMDRLNGRIGVESREGQGAVFFVELPHAGKQLGKTAECPGK